MPRPITTLFMLESLDGKISSGSTDDLDPDRDWSLIDGVKEGLHQYYELEVSTDLFSLNTGRVMAKIGVNERTDYPEKSVVTFIIIDNKPHLNERGVDYLCHWCKEVFLVTTNQNHIAHSLIEKYNNLKVIFYERLNLTKLLEDLYDKYNIEYLTIQSGGEMNGWFLRENLLDYVKVVVAPLLVGGRDTPTMIDGESIQSVKDLDKLRPLELMECEQLENSYIRLRYRIKK